MQYPGICGNQVLNTTSRKLPEPHVMIRTLVQKSLHAVKRFPASTVTGTTRRMASGYPGSDEPGVCANPDASTQDFIMQQTMMRIRDPKVSLDFYTRILGMRLLKKLDFPDMKFALYFVGFESAEDIPVEDSERARWLWSRKATVELTHNYGTESDEAFKGYHNGNSDPRGFGHIGISVPDVYAACERFEKLDVKFIKAPDGGKMKGLAFIQDPDGYWIEVLPNGR